MRGLLAGLLAILLAVTTPLALQAATSGAASPGTSVAESHVAPLVGECCTASDKTASDKTAHGHCAACVAAIQPAPDPTGPGSPRAVRLRPLSLAAKSAAPRLPIPPPRYSIA
ncbi:hypothetical protein [Paracoccus pacificus]|uniref:Uncharacterized protein n=1 Tax=Paracoccus pacificus TaxID=1463598 RepID=A0ABW4R5J7_9RHOB